MNKDWISLLLNIMLFAPLLGVPFVLLLKKQFARYTAFALSLIPLGIAVALQVIYRLNPEISMVEGGEFLFFSESMWFAMPSLDIKFMLGMDGISAYMVLLTTVIFPVMVLYSMGKVGRQEKLYYLMILILETGLIGFFLSLDMLMFYVFFELVLIPTTFFIGIWGGAKREIASMKFFLYTLAGSLVMLIAIIYLGLNVEEGVLTTDYFVIRDALAAGTIAAFGLSAQQWLFFAFAISFAIKMPIFPLHTWQPLTYSESSTTGSVILAALLSKMGAYGLIRFAIPLFPQVAVDWAPYISVFAVISIVYGAYLAVVQTNMKKLIAYASLSHMGFIVLGIFAFTPEALSGAVIQMVGHGVATAALFLLTGMLYERHQTKDIRGFQGIAKLAPKFTLFFMIAVMATVGLPGLSGFVGEFMILMGSFKSGYISGAFAVVGAVGLVIAAIYLLSMFRKMMFGETHTSITGKFFDLTRREVAVVAPLIALMFFIGLYAKPVLTQVNPGTDRVLSMVEAQLDAPSLTESEVVEEQLPINELKIQENLD